MRMAAAMSGQSGTTIRRLPTRTGAIVDIASVDTQGRSKRIRLNLNNTESEQLAVLFAVGSGMTEVFIP